MYAADDVKDQGQGFATVLRAGPCPTTNRTTTTPICIYAGHGPCPTTNRTATTPICIYAGHGPYPTTTNRTATTPICICAVQVRWALVVKDGVGKYARPRAGPGGTVAMIEGVVDSSEGANQPLYTLCGVILEDADDLLTQMIMYGKAQKVPSALCVDKLKMCTRDEMKELNYGDAEHEL